MAFDAIVVGTGFGRTIAAAQLVAHGSVAPDAQREIEKAKRR